MEATELNPVEATIFKIVKGHYPNAFIANEKGIDTINCNVGNDKMILMHIDRAKSPMRMAAKIYPGLDKIDIQSADLFKKVLKETNTICLEFANPDKAVKTKMNILDHYVIRDKMSSEQGYQVLNRSELGSRKFLNATDVLFIGTSEDCRQWINSPEDKRRQIEITSRERFESKVPLPSQSANRTASTGEQARMRF